MIVKKDSQQKQQDACQDPIDEASYQELHADYGLRGAFSHGRPLSREEYMNNYVLHGPGAYMVPPSYEDYLKLYDKYAQARSKRKLDSDFYLANMS